MIVRVNKTERKQISFLRLLRLSPLVKIQFLLYCCYNRRENGKQNWEKIKTISFPFFLFSFFLIYLTFSLWFTDDKKKSMCNKGKINNWKFFKCNKSISGILFQFLLNIMFDKYRNSLFSYQEKKRKKKEIKIDQDNFKIQQAKTKREKKHKLCKETKMKENEKRHRLRSAKVSHKC